MRITSTKSSPKKANPAPTEPQKKEENHKDAQLDTPLTFWERTEAYITRLSTKNNFWHRVCSLIWLPLILATFNRCCSFTILAGLAVLFHETSMF